MSPIATGRYIRRELMVEPRGTYHLIAWEYDAFLIWSWRYGGSVCDFLRSGWSDCVKMKWRALPAQAGVDRVVCEDRGRGGPGRGGTDTPGIYRDHARRTGEASVPRRECIRRVSLSLSPQWSQPKPARNRQDACGHNWLGRALLQTRRRLETVLRS
jgi:hypothetical protein